MPPREHRSQYLAAGAVDGLRRRSKCGVDEQADERRRATWPARCRRWAVGDGCVRAGGALGASAERAGARKRLERAIRYAQWTGASVVNTAMVSPADPPRRPGQSAAGRTGVPGRKPDRLGAGFCDDRRAAADHGRQSRPTWASRSRSRCTRGRSPTIRRRRCTCSTWSGCDNVGANPDLGNIYWQYEYPEETSEAAIVGAGATVGVLALQEPAPAAHSRAAPRVLPARAPCRTATSTTDLRSRPCSTPATTAIWRSKAPATAIRSARTAAARTTSSRS